MRRKFKIVILSSDELVFKDIYNRLRSCFVNTEIELHIVKEIEDSRPDIPKKSPRESIIDQLQHLASIIESNVLSLQSVSDGESLKKDELKTLLLAGQELADKVDQFSIYATHQLAELWRPQPVE